MVHAAAVLGVNEKTVRGYLLLTGHPRQSPFVSTSEHEAGRRALYSDLRAWQQRNRNDQPLVLELPRRANARHQGPGAGGPDSSADRRNPGLRKQLTTCPECAGSARAFRVLMRSCFTV